MGNLSTRAKTKEQLDSLKASLDAAVEEVRTAVQLVDGLSHEDMAEIMLYLDRSYPPSQNNNGFEIKGDVVYYDIGFALVKEQILKQLGGAPDKNQLFLDGTMGWLFYNPGPAHRTAMDSVASSYIHQFGAKDFIHKFTAFARLIETFVERGNQVVAVTKMPQLTYRDMFIQYASYPDLRFQDLDELLFQESN